MATDVNGIDFDLAEDGDCNVCGSTLVPITVKLPYDSTPATETRWACPECDREA